MSNIAVRAVGEEPQTIVVHHSQVQHQQSLDSESVSERRRVIRVLLLMWLVGSGQRETHLFA